MKKLILSLALLAAISSEAAIFTKTFTTNYHLMFTNAGVLRGITIVNFTTNDFSGAGANWYFYDSDTNATVRKTLPFTNVTIYVTNAIATNQGIIIRGLPGSWTTIGPAFTNQAGGGTNVLSWPANQYAYWITNVIAGTNSFPLSAVVSALSTGQNSTAPTSNITVQVTYSPPIAFSHGLFITNQAGPVGSGLKWISGPTMYIDANLFR